MAWKVRKLKFNPVDWLFKTETDVKRRRAMTPILKEPEVQRLIGDELVAAIIDRTNNGLDKNDKGFKGYKKSYKDSDNFKIYGKSSKVNLKLTGEMHAAIDVVKLTANTIWIGLDDSEDEAKAHGHINGGGSLPVRDFWGLPNDETIDQIMNDVIRDYYDDTLELQIEADAEIYRADVEAEEV